MSQDNKRKVPSCSAKNLELEARTEVSRPLRDPTSNCEVSSSAPAQVPHMLPSFVPRPFPPPALVGVPLEYIIDQLRHLAPHYWDDKESFDCTLIVPVFDHREQTGASPESLASSRRHDPSGLGRRVTEPIVNAVPRITMKLHVDYLSAQSTLLRALFSGTNPIDLINSRRPLTPSRFESSSPKPQPNSPSPMQIRHLPRLLASSPTHPVIYLPVPDPSSIQLLVHWMYFGHTHFIEDSLNTGSVRWEGILRNAEYLGLDSDIKSFLWRWHRSTISPGTTSSSPNDEDDEYDSGSDSDTSMTSMTSDDEDNAAFADSHRGRAGTTRSSSGIMPKS
ncbi:hypothetical protein JAAARDRAFT_32140 [Jaapia argillacea MUCL 33604]|uniref:BTB domain-containing protein n=1 Tax=Jaapia argillacea MUCL 33604 TaxID=933084 RepID=A0A067QET6_9AGAM|nr:hypothetical protein JAAARDRAFT_32140 [Jaapia argillacea MUCL 33604]